MALGNVDLVGIFEVMHRLDLGADDWLAAVTDALRPLVDRQRLGILGNFYSCPDACSYTPGSAVVRDVSVPLAAIYFSRSIQPPPTFLADTVMTRGYYLWSRVARWEDVREELEERTNVADKLSLNVIEPDGTGCLFGSFQRDRSPLSPVESRILKTVSDHLVAAHRLRHRFQSSRLTPTEADQVLDGNEGGSERTNLTAEATAVSAVMTADGRVHHAVGVAATDRCVRQDLGLAVRARDRARIRRGRQDSFRAIRDWKPFVGGRWMLLDHVERDGRKFVLAVESEPGDRLGLLSPRELDVVRRMLRGQPDKVIASELELAPTTVRVLRGRAMAKLGAHSRRDLRVIANALHREKEEGDVSG